MSAQDPADRRVDVVGVAPEDEVWDGLCFTCGLAFQEGDAIVTRGFSALLAGGRRATARFAFHEHECGDEDAILADIERSVNRLCDALHANDQERRDLIEVALSVGSAS